jgi:ADP-ribose pyrophosphatase YjhB (NUDIX family)
MILRGGLEVVKEAVRHLIRRPVARVAIAGRDSSGRWLLVRSADTGAWDLPRGTLEWGETIPRCVARQLRADANASFRGALSLRGVYSVPVREAKDHAVTILVTCEVGSDIGEARFFSDAELPATLAAFARDLISAVRRGSSDPVLE